MSMDTIEIADTKELLDELFRRFPKGMNFCGIRPEKSSGKVKREETYTNFRGGSSLAIGMVEMIKHDILWGNDEDDEGEDEE